MIYRLSSYGENDTYCLHTAGVTGSSPVSPTTPFNPIFSRTCLQDRSNDFRKQSFFKIPAIVTWGRKIGQLDPVMPSLFLEEKRIPMTEIPVGNFVLYVLRRNF